MTRATSYRLLITVSLVLSLLIPAAFAQETTAGIQGIVKDPSGAVVTGATVEVSGPALIGKKSSQTDSGGYYRFANLPPGTYTISVTARNFSNYKREGVDLATGHLPSIDINLQVGTNTETVEVTGAAPQVDVSQSKVQSNVTEDVINAIPKGRSYQSVIAFAPGARLEPLQDNVSGVGYQIDGASSTENAYLVEGQDTTGVVHGRGDTNVPFEFVQEVQIKSSGFEAEFGGALGGVVNVIQKRGGNDFHGSVFTYYSADTFNAAPNRSLRLNPLTVLHAGPAGGVARLAESPEYYQANKDHSRRLDPGFEVGGYLLKNRLWGFASFVPSFSTLSRPVFMTSVNSVRTFNQDVNTYNAFARLDGALTSRIRLFGSWQYGYQKAQGTSLPTADSRYGQRNTSVFSAATLPDQFNYGLGYVAPSVIDNVGADITLTSSLVATTRFGYFFSDLQNRGFPAGDRYLQQNTTTAASKDANGVALPASLIVSVNQANIASNKTQQFDKTGRKSFSQDIAYFRKTSFGTHNIKGGYALNKINENILNGFQGSFTTVFVASAYSPVTATGQANCAAIAAASGASYGNANTCQGRYGYFIVGGNTTETKGKVGSTTQALYLQDSWTVGHGLTINAGIRFDKEFLPSFKPGANEIKFGFGDKTAPRIGASWDVLRNGKVKLYGSYGKFFDIMKYELPQGSFGGQYWHQCVYGLDDPNYAGVLPTRGPDGNICPTGGASAHANGTIPAADRFIENNDLRIPANDPSDNRIVPGIKPMEQHELVFGADWAINSTLAFESRYSRKRLDRTIEDIGALQAGGEAFFIGNPGFGAIGDQSGICPACARQPKAIRNYDGLEFRLTRRATGHWFGTVSYTYSKLYGNYSGLSSTDEAGRNDPNVSRMFDEPHYQFDSHGKYALGPLATDRPHTFKAFGFYSLKWWHMETLVGGTQQWFSGTPITSQITAAGGTPQLVENRGNFADISVDANGVWTLNSVHSKRTPQFSQSDLNFVHNIHVSKTNEAMRVTLEANIINVFNQHSILNYQNSMLRSGSTCPPPGGCGTPNYDALMHSGWDYIAAANTNKNVLSGTYGLPNLFQTGRTMRFNMGFSF